MSHQEYYTQNSTYTKFVDNQKSEHFSKLIDTISLIYSKNMKILDAGCGTGIAMKSLELKHFQVQGIEISKSSFRIAKRRGLLGKLYRGKRFPYSSEFFDIVYSFNVLEHTDNPLLFLQECMRVLSKNGYLIIACPNFYAVTNSYHYRTAGMYRKIKNIWNLIKLWSIKGHEFEFIKPIKRIPIMADDDAVVATNPISIINYLRSLGAEKIYWSSLSRYYTNSLQLILDKTPLKIVMGSCFMIFKKKPQI